MKNYWRQTFTSLNVIGALLVPHLVQAQVQLINPLGTGEDATDPRVLIARLIQAILSVVGSIALLMFVYGGVLWITSFGEPARVEKGKKILVWTVLGLALIASAYVIVNALLLGLTTGSATAV